MSRPRLLERLDAGLQRALVLVCAPAGYGKTVLLASWARRARPAAAWLSLDVGDNDPSRFWRHVLAALDRARSGLAERVAPLLGPPAPTSFDPLVTALINELAAAPDSDEVLLVLDDYHLIDAPQVHASVDSLLQGRPAGFHLVLASRSDPPLALARLRVRGELAEVRSGDLKFTTSEAAALLRRVAAVPEPALTETAAAALTEHTEGWAAGLQLAALSLRGTQDVAGFVAAFTGSQRYVLDFLAEEVLDRQEAELRDFLLKTSILERLSGPLCQAVTGRVDSQQLLERIERAGLFLVPLDEVRGWWRYHQLFAAVLRARLHAEQPDEVSRQLHGNAASWCAAHGLGDEAISHALAAGRPTWAAKLIEQQFDEYYTVRGEGATIERWLSALPAELVRTRPRLLLAQAQLWGTVGRLADMQHLVDAAEQVASNATGETFEPTAGRAASLLVNVPAHIALDRAYLAQLDGDAQRTAEFASRALAECAKDEWLLKSTVQGFLAVAAELRGQLAAAETTFAAGVAGWRAAGQHTHAAWGAYSLARVQRERGRLDAAIRTSQQALEAAQPPGRPMHPAAGLALVGLAAVAYQRNDLETAMQHLSQGIPLCRRYVFSPPLAAGLATLAWIRQATGDPATAVAAMDEAVEVAASPAGPLNPVPAERTRLLLAQGDLTGAAQWTEDRGLGADDHPDYPREPGHLVLARVLLGQGRADSALALLDRLDAAAATQRRTGSLIEIGALRALALAASGQEAAAVNALAATLTIACPLGYVRVFADEGPPLAMLLRRLIAAQRSGHAAATVSLECLARLQRAFDTEPSTPDGRPAAAAALPGIIEPLTSRELEVLHLLAAGMSNQGIARRLVLSIDTVKKHVSHVLSKLGAASRTEAVARARQLGLIP